MKGNVMLKRDTKKHSVKAVSPRCYETTVDFHFQRNADGLVIAVDNATGKQVGEIVTMGDLVGGNRRFFTPAWSR